MPRSPRPRPAPRSPASRVALAALASTLVSSGGSLVSSGGSLVAAALGSATACTQGAPAAPAMAGAAAQAPEAAVPFEAVPPAVYVAKVKNLLVGAPPTDAEVAAVVADPAQLKGLIDGWMALPEYTAKMKVFFELAFQQTQVADVDFADQAYPKQMDINGTTTPLLVQNAIESFSRTVLALIAQGSPLTDAITTQTFMMTPALMEVYAFFDAWQVDDAGDVTDRFKQTHPKQTITVEASAGPIPIAESLDPTSPNYMHWYDPDVANDATTGAGCGADPIVYPASGVALHYLLEGALDGHKNAAGGTCGTLGGTAAAPQLTTTDYTTWKMVTIRTPKSGEAPTAFYDLPSLRASTELVLTIPRVGFFTTPAFFANWQTNTSNTMRVTTNQALIVATGASIDGTDTTTPSTTPGLDAAHAAPGSACFQCHQLLDPTRSVLAATYSWNYHDQADPTYAGQLGLFAFEGVVKPVSSVADFGAALASHPLFAAAWVQKLAYYANSVACDSTDPEFQRIVGVFQSSGYSWNALVRELLSSPLTTYAGATQTALADGQVVAVARRDHLCAALNVRLGFTDVCGLDATTTKAKALATVSQIVAGLPSDGYGRGAVAPVLPNQPTLFYRAGTENICEAIAAEVVDPAKSAGPGVRVWSSAQPTAAIADFVSVVMGLTSGDARAAAASSILNAHFTSALQQGATATDALRSTFVAACMAPSAVSIGL